MKKIYKRMVSILLCMTLIFSLSIVTQAKETPNSEVTAFVVNENGVIDSADVMLESHELTEIDGNAVYTDTYITEELEAPIETTNSGINPASSIEGVENFVKYTGRIVVTYTKNNTTAKLISVSGTWTYAHGTYVEMSYTDVVYGQDLGTNSANGRVRKYGTSFSVTTNFTAGKYGYNSGHKLGANMTGHLANGTNYYVQANLPL